MIYKNGVVFLGFVAWNTWMGLNDSLSPMKLCTNVCICSYASFSVDAPIFSSHSQIPQHFKPLCQTQAHECHRAEMRWDGCILPITRSKVGAERKDGLLCSLFPFSLLPQASLPSSSLILSLPRIVGWTTLHHIMEMTV